MPIGTRLSTPIPRAYLSDPRLAAVKSALAREAFFRMKLTVDNLGRMPGDAAMVAGLLYPSNPPPAAQMAKVLAELDRAGLVLWYRSGPVRFVQVPDTGSTQKIIGHMATSSEYPAPPDELLSKWQKKTGLAWQAVRVTRDFKGKGSNGVRTASEPSSNGVSLSQEESCSVVLSSAVLGGDGHDAPAGARSPVGSLTSSTCREKEPFSDRDSEGHRTFSQWLGVGECAELPGQFVGAQALHVLGKLAGGRYQPSLDFATDEGDAWAAFAQLVVDAFEQLRDEPYCPVVGDEKLMSCVVNIAQNDGRVRRGWIKLLSDVRRELKSTGLRVVGGVA